MAFPRKRAANGSVALRVKQKRGGHFSLWVPTEEDKHTVTLGVAWGLALEVICSQIINPDTGLPISVETLQKNFHFELQNGKQLALSRIATSLYDSAVRLRDTRAGIFILKARGNWREDGDTASPDASKAVGGVALIPADASPDSWAAALKQHQAALTKRESDDDA